MTKHSTLMKVFKLVSYAIWHALHACKFILKPNLLLFRLFQKNWKILQLKSMSIKFTQKHTIGLRSSGAPYMQHFKNRDTIVHCITQQLQWFWKQLIVILEIKQPLQSKKALWAGTLSWWSSHDFVSHNSLLFSQIEWIKCRKMSLYMLWFKSFGLVAWSSCEQYRKF